MHLATREDALCADSAPNLYCNCRHAPRSSQNDTSCIEMIFVLVEPLINNKSSLMTIIIQ